MSARRWIPWGCVLVLGCQALPGEDGLRLDPPRLEASATRVQLPDADIGQAVETRVTLSNPGGGTAHFHARLEPASSSLSLQDADGQAQRGRPGILTLRHLGEFPGTVSATLVVDHDGQGPAVEMQVLATTRPPPDCEDHNPCTLDRVDPSAPGGCLHTAMEGTCDDGNLCTTADRCVEGTCTGQALACDDGIACTVDRCDPTRGCVADPVAARCDDGDPCTGDTCDVDQRGCAHATLPTGSPCGASSCETVHLCVAGECLASATPDGYPCDDGDPCTRGDACQAGACVPGGGGGTALGAPQFVVETRLDTLPEIPVNTALAYPLGGYWPVAVDGVVPNPQGTLPDTSLVPPSAATVLWRGTRDGVGDGCYRNPAQCTEVGNACAPAARAPFQTSLLISQVDVGGGLLDTQALDAGAAYTMAARDEAGRRGGNGNIPLVPDHTLENVAVVNEGNHLLGAALFRFAEGCPTCFGGEAAPDGGAPVVTCLPAGRLLVIFQVDTGLTAILATHWVDLPDTDLLLLKGGLPMLTAAATPTQLGVAWGSLGPICDACDVSGTGYTAHLLRYARTPNGIPVDPTLVQRPLSAAWPGVVDNVDDFNLVADGWCLGWTQRATSLPPVNSCSDGAELRDAWRACLDNPSALAAVHQPLVKGYFPVDAARGFSWQRTGQGGGAPECTLTDSVDFRVPDGATNVMTRALNAQPGLAHANVATLQDVPVFLATDSDGRASISREGAAPVTGGFAAGVDARLSPLHPLRAGGNTASGFMLTTVAEVGLHGDALPLPSMVLVPWSCGSPAQPFP